MNSGADTKWFKVFESEDEAFKNVLLNKAVTVQVEDKKICLARIQDGFFAVADACPHLGAPLSRGFCNNFGEIICPWHNYRYNLKTGDEVTGHNLEVESFKVEMRNDGLYIGI